MKRDNAIAHMKRQCAEKDREDNKTRGDTGVTLMMCHLSFNIDDANISSLMVPGAIVR